MALGTFESATPPFFRQGPSALTRLAFFAALAVFLMVGDTRFAVVAPLRAGLATVLDPIQRVLLWPVDMAANAARHAQSLRSTVETEQSALAAATRRAQMVASVEVLTQENARLRQLLDLSTAQAQPARAAEIRFTAADPYSRKVFIDRGSVYGVAPGSAVINEDGVLGQVTRVYPLSAEVTLLTDKDAAIPVLNVRSQQRSVAVGGADGTEPMELRFMAGNADVQTGDALVTSGLDGVYPAGLAVAKVVGVDRRSDGGFARVTLTPAANADAVRHVLVLDPQAAGRDARPSPGPSRARGSRP